LNFAASQGFAPVQQRLRGYLVEAPLVRMAPASAPPKLKLLIGRLISHVLPRFQITSQMDTSLYCRDPAVVHEYENDPYCHDTGSLECFAGIFDTASRLDAGHALPLRNDDRHGSLWLGHGTADGVTSCDGTALYFDRLGLPDVQFERYDGAYHKLHREPDGVKERFTANVADWILARASPTTGEGHTPVPKLRGRRYHNLLDWAWMIFTFGLRKVCCFWAGWA